MTKTYPKKTTDSFSQTDEIRPAFKKCAQFVSYSCFYCGKLITSQRYLSEHVKKCISLPDQNLNKRNPAFTLFSDQNKLDCNKSEPQIGQNSAIDVYHSLLTALQKQTLRKLPCDKCKETFESESVLELHKMFSHGGFGKS